MVFAAEALARAGGAIGGRPPAQHRHRRGVNRGRRIGVRPHAQRRRGDRHRADRPAGMGRLPRQPARANPHPGTRRTRRAAGPPSRRWRRGQRDREAGNRPGRDPPATPALVEAPKAPVSVGARLRPDSHARRRVDRLLPLQLRTRLPHRIPARSGRRGRLGIVGRRRVRRLDRPHRGRRPMAGRPPAPDRLAARRRPPSRGPTDEPIVQTALASLRSIGLPAHGSAAWTTGTTARP